MKIRIDRYCFALLPFLCTMVSGFEIPSSDCGAAGAESVSLSGQALPVRTFPYPDIPGIIVSPEDRKAYLLEHYWDRFDFADSLLLADRDITEQGFVNFCALLMDKSTPQELIDLSVDRLCSAIEKQCSAPACAVSGHSGTASSAGPGSGSYFSGSHIGSGSGVGSVSSSHSSGSGIGPVSGVSSGTGGENSSFALTVFSRLADDYLYQPNSPLFNEPLYLVWLRRMSRSKRISDVWRDSFAFKLSVVSRNLPGSVATDFHYTLPDGRSGSLLETTVSGDFLLVLFFDPECDNCHALTNRLQKDPEMLQAIADGRVTLLAVYTENDDAVWRDAPSLYPSSWTLVNDCGSVRAGLLYDLKAMPTLYLLDRQKHVLLKDATLDAVLDFLRQPLQA